MRKMFTLILALSFIFGGLANAQQKFSLAPKSEKFSVVKNVEKSTVPTKGAKGILDGTTVTCSSLWEEGTQTLNFTMTYTQTGGEYMDGLEMVFPEGMVPNVEGTTTPLATPVSGSSGHLNLSITGQTVMWGLPGTSGYGAYQAGTIEFQVNVTNSGLVGPQTINYTFYGDRYTSGPNVFNGSLVISESLEHNLGVVDIVPNVILSGSNVTPQVAVKNFGTSTESDFTVNLVINDGSSDVYTSSKNITEANLVSMDTIDVVMDDVWTDVPAGLYTITATVVLTGDGDDTNDELGSTCEVLDGIFAFGANSSKSGAFYLNTPLWENENNSTVEVFGGTLINGVFYGVTSDEDFGYFNSEMDTWTNIGQLGVAGQSFIISLAYDAVNDKIYTLGLSGSYPAFTVSIIEINPETGAGTIVSTGSTGATLLAIACSSSGQMYGVTHAQSGNGSFYSIEPATGTMTLIGDIGGVVSSYFQSMAFHPTTDVCYFQAFDDEGAMNGTYTIDIATGVATSQGIPLADQINGFAIPVGPRLVEVTPANNAVDVALDATVSATFHTNLTAVDLTGITITPDPGNVSASINNAVLTIAHDAFDYKTTYTVFVPAGAVSDGADSTTNSTTWSFKTVLDPTACNEPTGIVFSDIQAEQATVAWTETGAGTSWRVKYGATGFDPDTEGEEVVVNEQTATITELTANTTYEVYVQALCGTDETSGWSGSAIFATACGAISTYPYFEGFEGETFPPTCWSTIDADGDGDNWTQIDYNQHSGTYGAMSASYINNVGPLTPDNYLISPKFEINADDLELSVWRAAQDPNYPKEKYSILVSKTGTDVADFTEIFTETLDTGDDQWGEVKLSLSAYNGQSIYIAIRHWGTTDVYQIVFDDFKIDHEVVSTEAKILTYSFAEQYAAATVDNANSKVDIEVKENTDVTALVATFTLSDGATAQVGGVDQISGTTANDFTNPVTYKVTAQDGTTTRDWTINVSIHSGIETAESSAITIYPNPSNGRFTLDFGDINGKVNYQIFDTKGSIILSDNFVANGSAIQEVSLNLVSGIYFVKLVTETQSIIEKLVIE